MRFTYVAQQRLWLTFTLSFFFQPTFQENVIVSNKTVCRNIPGDSTWPSGLDWAQLNTTIEGRLIATTPLASVCHEPQYDNQTCNSLKEKWPFASTFVHAPADFNFPYFQNRSCDPFTSPESECRLGNYASYSIDVTNVSDVQAGIKFAREKNIRLTIKNTGHDLLGKSTGKGALSLWTHNLNTIEFFDHYAGEGNYSSLAVRLGAGVLTEDVFAAANKTGVRVVTGTCPTIGVAGGYTSGGGHGVFTSLYGMAADNVLEWEVVTANGEHLVATPTDPDTADLYWALSGGGAGTFGVVISMTSRVYPDAPMAGTSFGFDVDSAGGDDEFWRAVTIFQSSLSPVVDAGAVASYAITPTSLDLIGIAVADGNETRTREILQPIVAALATVNISLELNITTHSGFLDFFDHYFLEAVTTIPDAQITGSRFFPRIMLESNVEAESISQAIRVATDAGFSTICDAVNANRTSMYDNAVSPAWRSTLLHCIFVQSWNFTIPWSEMLARQDQLTNNIMPQIEAVTPGGGAYLNEANFEQANWQDVFYGSNYARLKEIKDLRDPGGVFYAGTAVGSEAWGEDSEGRLCQA